MKLRKHLNYKEGYRI